MAKPKRAKKNPQQNGKRERRATGEHKKREPRPQLHKGERRERRDRQRRERRFAPQWTKRQTASLVAGGLGSALAGAGVWARWGSEPPHDFAIYLLAAGAVFFGVGTWFLGTGDPIRVGDAGVATEKGSEIRRLAWCEIERISEQAGSLRIEGKQLTLEIPLGVHRLAAAWVLSEAARRVPDIMDVKPSVVERLPTPQPRDGEVMPVTGLQVAGWHCAVSGKAIAFERDARLCPNCGQVYHHTQVPPTCQTCHQELGERAISAA
jgi:hypothetical protein